MEDEMLLAMDLEATLEENGFDVLAPVRNVEEALAALKKDRPDVVTLDMNLDGTSSAPIAAELVMLGIPFVLLSGYSSDIAGDSVFDNAPLVRKPFETAPLIDAIDSICSLHTGKQI